MSSSILITKQLEQESAELRQYIHEYLVEKTQEFTDNLKHKIGQYVNSQLLSFYCRPSHDNTLFDKEGDTLLAKIHDTFKEKNWTQLVDEYQGCLFPKNKRCFWLKEGDSTFYFYERCVVVTGFHYLYAFQDSEMHFSIMPHSLNLDMLRTIKHFQLSKRGNLEQGLTLYRVHPEFFHSNCTEFEAICSREYQDIREKQAVLDRLIQEGETIEMERQKLNEEKRQWGLIKEKLGRMRMDLEKVMRQEDEIDEIFHDIF